MSSSSTCNPAAQRGCGRRSLRVRVHVVPLPLPPLVTITDPRMRAATARVTDSPWHAPPYFLLVAGSTRHRGTNNRSTSSSVIPTPLSTTEISSRQLRGAGLEGSPLQAPLPTRTVTLDPDSEYLMPLAMTCSTQRATALPSHTIIFGRSGCAMMASSTPMESAALPSFAVTGPRIWSIKSTSVSSSCGTLPSVGSTLWSVSCESRSMSSTSIFRESWTCVAASRRSCWYGDVVELWSDIGFGSAARRDKSSCTSAASYCASCSALLLAACCARVRRRWRPTWSSTSRMQTRESRGALRTLERSSIGVSESRTEFLVIMHGRIIPSRRLMLMAWRDFCASRSSMVSMVWSAGSYTRIELSCCPTASACVYPQRASAEGDMDAIVPSALRANRASSELRRTPWAMRPADSTCPWSFLDWVTSVSDHSLHPVRSSKVCACICTINCSLAACTSKSRGWPSGTLSHIALASLAPPWNSFSNHSESVDTDDPEYPNIRSH
mmetsp:Transcript_27095/g.62456  ORF Transcript_27095/g.62456 Transcript_27095/m.62456 type:complete len:496 (-) Transcript_27095:980-2467(-)